MSSKLKSRISRLEQEVEPTIDEAMAWVHKNNPAAGKVIKGELSNRIVVRTYIPDPDPLPEELKV